MTEFSGISGRTALVTGAGRGIGRACTLGLAEAGAHVIAVARTSSDLQSLASAASSPVECWREDVTTDQFYARLEALESLDILVNNAGMNRPLPIEAVDPSTLDAMLALNIRALYRTSQSAVRVMLRNKKPGSIIHMSSQMGHVGAARRTVYCMTKHAVEGLTKSLAVELAHYGIRVNSVAPTFVETTMTRTMFQDTEFRQAVLDDIPIGRIGTPQDVVGAVLFLASSASAMITGDSVKVDGGWTAK